MYIAVLKEDLANEIYALINKNDICLSQLWTSNNKCLFFIQHILTVGFEKIKMSGFSVSYDPTQLFLLSIIILKISTFH